jgi:hypothetical protein
MKKYYFSIITILYSALGYSQLNWEWANCASGDRQEVAISLDVDNNDNVYVIGEYWGGTVYFPNDTITPYGTNTLDIFFAKLNSSGQFEWVKSAGGADHDIGMDIEVDEGNDIIIAGYFHSPAEFGSNVLTSQYDNDVFLGKYNEFGSLVWIKSLGTGVHGFDGSEILDVEIDSEQNIYITGFIGPDQFGGDTLLFFTDTLLFNYFNYEFIAKFDKNGNYIWAKTFSPGPIPYGIKQFKLSLDDNGNCYLAGSFSENLFVENDTIVSVGSADAAILKYNENGDYIWGKIVGSNSYDDFTDIDIISNNIYLSGSNGDSTYFDNYILTDWGQFYCKCDLSGNFLWVKKFQFGYPHLTTDEYENAYLTREFSGQIIIGSDTLTAQTEGVFITRIDPNGCPIWSIQSDGYGGAFVKDIDYKNNNVYICGSYGGNLLFNSSSILSTDTLYSDLYVVKASVQNNFITSLSSDIKINVYPNPFSNYCTVELDKYIKDCLVEIYNSLGIKVYQQHVYDSKNIIIKRNNLAQGIYYLRLCDKYNLIGNAKIILE